MRLRPCSPSRERACRLGIIGVRMFMMIEAVMYGYTPSAATLSCLSAPPEKMFSVPRNAYVLLLPSKAWSSNAGSTPGIGMWATTENDQRRR
jgi:hypothetical protein